MPRKTSILTSINSTTSTCILLQYSSSKAGFFVPKIKQYRRSDSVPCNKLEEKLKENNSSKKFINPTVNLEKASKQPENYKYVGYIVIVEIENKRPPIKVELELKALVAIFLYQIMVGKSVQPQTQSREWRTTVGISCLFITFSSLPILPQNHFCPPFFLFTSSSSSSFLIFFIET